MTSDQNVNITSSCEAVSDKPADLDSICEGISRAIVEGLVEKEFLEEKPVAPTGKSVIDETAVIDTFDEELDNATEKTASTVEDLLDSADMSDRIVRLVQEKVEQVLDEDLSHSRSGDSGIIAERVHLECSRLFGRESFRGEIVRLLRGDVQRKIVPSFRKEILDYIQHILVEMTNHLVDKIVEVLSVIRGGMGEPVNGEPPAKERDAEDVHADVEDSVAVHALTPPEDSEGEAAGEDGSSDETGFMTMADTEEIAEEDEDGPSAERDACRPQQVSRGFEHRSVLSEDHLSPDIKHKIDSIKDRLFCEGEL